MDKSIVTIGLVIFSIVFLGFLAIKVVAPSMTKGNAAATSLSDTYAMIDMSSIQEFNEVSVIGTKVLEAIRTGKTLNGSSKMAIIVKTADGSERVYGYAVSGSAQTGTYKNKSGTSKVCSWDSSSQYNQSLEIDSTKNGFINENAQYFSAPIRNQNDVITGIYFEQE